MAIVDIFGRYTHRSLTSLLVWWRIYRLPATLIILLNSLSAMDIPQLRLIIAATDHIQPLVKTTREDISDRSLIFELRCYQFKGRSITARQESIPHTGRSSKIIENNKKMLMVDG